jgi:hypothetical protein
MKEGIHEDEHGDLTLHVHEPAEGPGSSLYEQTMKALGRKKEIIIDKQKYTIGPSKEVYANEHEVVNGLPNYFQAVDVWISRVE